MCIIDVLQEKNAKEEESSVIDLVPARTEITRSKSIKIRQEGTSTIKLAFYA